METKFEEYFYHDILIKEMSIKNSDNESALLEFILVNEESQIFKCIFKKVFLLSFVADFSSIGNVFIAHAFVSESDESMLEYKNNKMSFIPLYVLDKIKCYIIYTTHGQTIKILSEDDIIVSNL